MTDSEICYVIGSGPAGISCAQGLLSAGKQVVILDSGLTLEAERQGSLTKLAGLPPSSWSRNDIAFIRDGVSSGSSGIPLKLAYGSDYPYRNVPGSTAIELAGPETKPSYARGGLSTVWGSAVLPYRQADIPDWPIGIRDLEDGYRAVLGWMPFSARVDDLSALFPLYFEKPASLPMSNQAAGLLNDLTRNKSELNREGVFFGSARLAVKAECVKCGLCMYGCPHGLIYSAEQTLTRLAAERRLQYRSGITVQRVSEKGSQVLIEAVDSSGKMLELKADRVFLGAGLLNTTTILLRSLQKYNTPVQIQDSQYFLLPLLRFTGTGNVTQEPLHTLSQLFFEIFDEAISPYTIHLQTYTYNDLYREPVMAKLGPLKSVFPMESFLGRLLLFQGYLHSSHSGSISATLLHNNGSGDVLKLQSSPNPETKQRVIKINGKLLKLARETGLLPLRPMLQMGKAGRGFHSGGSFPMSHHPTENGTDTLGRPPGFDRVHAIDSTVLPTIPATTITFTVMANAYRIGKAVGSEAQ